MKKTLLLFALLLVFQASLSAQVITPEEVVLKGRTTLAPATYRQPAWLPGTSLWAWVEGQSLYLLANGSDSAYVALTLDELNGMHQQQGLDSLKAFPLYNWKEGKQAWYFSGGNLVLFSLAEKNLTLKNTFDPKAANLDVETEFFSVAYTRDNNLYINSRGTEIPVTRDANPAIVNGQSVHRNEFGINKGTFWSPRGNLLAFYRMDESMVTEYPILDLEQTPAQSKNIRYPMAGDSSHQVKVGVFNVLKQKTTWLQVTGPADQYLTNITWTPDERFIWVAVLNRDQNHMQLQQFDAATGARVATILEEKHEAYVEPLHGPLFLRPDGSRFIWQSERTGHNHLYLYKGTEEPKALTQGDWDVLELLGTSTDGNKLYIWGATTTGMERHLWVADMEQDTFYQVTREPGTHQVKVNLQDGAYLDFFTSWSVPRIIRVCDNQGREVKELLKASNPIAAYDSCEVRRLTFITEDSVMLNARMILPFRFDSTRTYPVLVYVYGGPHAQMVTDSWLGGADLWLYSMAQRGYIVFTLDNRGSGNRGKEFEQYTFRKLGEAEAYDQMLGVNYLRNLSYVNSKEIQVFGWSFGGFMTINLMTRHPEMFQKGVAGGPVCDWRMYEVMYTERYMDTPEANPEGYAGANLLNRIGKLRGDLMLIHGTSDDVVLWQHSLALQQSAVQKGVILDYMSYPGHAHNVMGKDRIHLYKTVSRYLTGKK